MQRRRNMYQASLSNQSALLGGKQNQIKQMQHLALKTGTLLCTCHLGFLRTRGSRLRHNLISGCETWFRYLPEPTSCAFLHSSCTVQTKVLECTVTKCLPVAGKQCWVELCRTATGRLVSGHYHISCSASSTNASTWSAVTQTFTLQLTLVTAVI